MVRQSQAFWGAHLEAPQLQLCGTPRGTEQSRSLLGQGPDRCAQWGSFVHVGSDQKNSPFNCERFLSSLSSTLTVSRPLSASCIPPPRSHSHPFCRLGSHTPREGPDDLPQQGLGTPSPRTLLGLPVLQLSIQQILS